MKLKQTIKEKITQIKQWVAANPKKAKIYGATAVVVIAGAALFLTFFTPTEIGNRIDLNGDAKNSESEIQIIPSPLTGVMVSRELAERPVTGIMIENSPSARPHSGLIDAGVAFEAIAEGGITRYLALYQETRPEFIGPVRSLRPYFVNWALSYDAAVAHVGGSPKALSWARKYLKERDLDQFKFGARAFDRVSFRASPHNVYTNFDDLDRIIKEQGIKESNFRSMPRKKEKPVKEPNAKRIKIQFSSATYNTSYTYDKSSNSYFRSVGGAAHKDRETGKQIKPKVLVVMKTNYSLSGEGSGRQQVTTIGKGDAYIFQDGTVKKGTWIKSTRDSRIAIKDKDGKLIKLNPGQTWISVIPNDKSVSFK